MLPSTRMRHRLLGSALGLVLTCATSGGLIRGQSPEQNLREQLREAFAAHQAGRYEQAVRGYEAFLASHPEVADVHSNLGAAYAQLGRLADAIKSYRRALLLGNASQPNGTRFNLALALYKSAQFPAAMVELRQVLSQDPRHLNAALVLADCALQQENYAEVIQVLAPFEAAYGDDKGLAYLLGTALIRSGEVEKGQLLIDRILRDGDSAEAHLLMGTAYMMVRDVTGAVREFERALALNPRLPGANAYMARGLREMGRVDEALPYSQRELEVNPFDYESHLYVGVYLYKREQDYEGALRHLRRCLDIRPGAIEARFQIALVQILQGQVREALGAIEQIVQEAPTFLEAHVTLTSLYYRLQRREDAERHRKIVEELRAEKDRQTVKEMAPQTEGPGGREAP